MTTTPAQPIYPLASLPNDGVAITDEDGENQTCPCGNDSQAADWVPADTTGAMTFEASGSSNPAEHTVCPECGRLYRNADLFTGAAAPIARYDVTSAAFTAALAQYNRYAFTTKESR
ncbi:hypothetical protein [Agreia sp. COWG]|uniref:hypothetical protein n=1 Tax=Agreia sp. COWG TaxID=2773266 RepID=UPI001928F5CA|nr:hypothetical protein [Agreia sp. COWG]CAD6016161.1 conserved protein of unknown function [Agreia sp. COWG]